MQGSGLAGWTSGDNHRLNGAGSPTVEIIGFNGAPGRESNSTSFHVFDEVSAVPDKFLEVAEGGLSDAEPMFRQFSNPARSAGAFHRATFGSERKRWIVRSIDSRTCKFSNRRAELPGIIRFVKPQLLAYVIFGGIIGALVVRRTIAYEDAGMHWYGD